MGVDYTRGPPGDQGMLAENVTIQLSRLTGNLVDPSAHWGRYGVTPGVAVLGFSVGPASCRSLSGASPFHRGCSDHRIPAVRMTCELAA